MKVLLLIILGLIPVIPGDVFTDGVLQLTANIYREMRKTEPGNFFVCPLSVATILALLYSGAKDNTAKQLSTALHITPETFEKYNNITFFPLESTDQYNLSTANAIYINKNFTIKDGFKNNAIKSYGSEVLNIDFSEKDKSAGEINKWVEEKTHDKIKNLLSSSDLDNNTRVVLVNAIFFKGIWEKTFNASYTNKKPFQVDSQTRIDVEMMVQTSDFNYYENTKLKAKFLEMKYAGGNLRMIFVLPNDIQGLRALEEAHIDDILKTPPFYSQTVHVEIPKFKLESTIQFKPILQALGIVDAFEDNANFSEISEVPLKIHKVIQKTLIEVHEEGTTAAASTAVIENDLLKFRPVPKQFIACHPFIYILKFNEAILFIGRYKNPAN